MDIARLYREAQRSFVDFTQDFTEADWAATVPCTPRWTVHDTVSHVAGVTDDVLNGRVEGAATEPWTASQVERWRDTPRAQLIAQWNSQVDAVAEALEAFGERRPPIDCHMHEHDVRQALGRPGNRDSEIVATMVQLLAAEWDREPIEITFADGSTITTAGTGAVRRLAGVTPFDVARSALGRRSRGQVVAWNWSEPPSGADLDAWFTFGPSVADIVE